MIVSLFKKGSVLEAKWTRLWRPDWITTAPSFWLKLQKRISWAWGLLRESQTPRRDPSSEKEQEEEKRMIPQWGTLQGPRSIKCFSMQRASQAVRQEPEQQKSWGMAQTCMIHGDKTCGALFLGMRSLRAWLCPCLPWVCRRRRR